MKTTKQQKVINGRWSSATFIPDRKKGNSIWIYILTILKN